MALATVASAGPVTGQTQPSSTQAATNDARAQPARFQPPPPPTGAASPPRATDQPANESANNDQTATSGQPRRLWRDLLDSLLDLMAPRALSTARLLDDPLTTGFGNTDFVEPLPGFDPARQDVHTAADEPR